MQQHLMQMQPMMAPYYPNNVTTDHIQQVSSFCFFFAPFWIITILFVASLEKSFLLGFSNTFLG
jgi:hypothetical protein